VQMPGALQTREALLDAGAVLAEEHGLAGASVEMVVSRAGVARGTFYVHFKDRAAFVDAMPAAQCRHRGGHSSGSSGSDVRRR